MCIVYMVHAIGWNNSSTTNDNNNNNKKAKTKLSIQLIPTFACWRSVWVGVVQQETYYIPIEFCVSVFHIEKI